MAILLWSFSLEMCDFFQFFSTDLTAGFPVKGFTEADCVAELMKMYQELIRYSREIQEKIILRSRENGSHLINNFTAIINNDRIGVPIPENQLFNPETND